MGFDPNTFSLSSFILVWFLQTIALLITALLIPRFTIAGPVSALKFVVTLSLINTTLWNTNLFATIPNSLTAHSLTVVLANAVLFWVLAKLVHGVNIDGIMPAIVGPIVFTIISAGTYSFGKDIDWMSVFHQAQKAVETARDVLQEDKIEAAAEANQTPARAGLESKTPRRSTPGRAGEKGHR